MSSGRATPAMFIPHEDELKKLDVIDTIAENMAARGFTSLWSQPKKAGSHFDDGAKKAYLIKLATCGRKATSAAYAGVCERAVQRAAKRDPAFGASVEEALAYFRDLIQGEMYRRGVEGFTEEVLGGKNRDQIFKVKKYSDKLLTDLARIHIPEMRKDIAGTVINNNTETKVISNQFDMDNMPAEDMAMLKQLLQNQAKRVEDAEADALAIEGEVLPDGK